MNIYLPMNFIPPTIHLKTHPDETSLVTEVETVVIDQHHPHHPNRPGLPLPNETKETTTNNQKANPPNHPRKENAVAKTKKKKFQKCKKENNYMNKD
jgi:hypothetical protein